MADSDAQFAIDIAASMGGGEQTLAELDALTAQLTGAGKNAEHFQAAIKQLSTELTAAAEATAAANSELAAGQSHYSDLEKAALQASKAAEKAAAKNAGVVPPELLAAAEQANTELNTYAGTLKQLEANAAKASGKEAQLAQNLTNVKKLSSHANTAIAKQAEDLEKLSSAIGAVGGPVGKLGQALLKPLQGFTKLSGSMGEADAAMVLLGTAAAATVFAVVAVGAAAVVAAAKIAVWAVGLADAARNASLTQEAVAAMHPEIAALSGEIDSLNRETGLSAGALQGIAKQLTAAKVAAGDMPAALRAAALAERALGSGGASEFIDQIKEGKKSVGELATETQSKLGGIVQRQMLSLESQSATLEKNISDIFGGLKIEPVLNGMQTLVRLFDKNSAAGKAMSFLFKKIFQPLIDQAENAAYVVEAFFLGFLIGATKLYIALKPAIKAVSEFFGFDDSALTDLLTGAKDAGEIAAYAFAGLAVAFGVVVGAIGVLVGAMTGFVTLVAGLPVILSEAASALGAMLGKAISDAIDFIRSIDMVQVGTDLIMGLAAGITGAAGAVVNAIGGAVQGAIASAKSLLGIASPSKVFEEIGGFTGEGFVGGVESENDNAQAALADMASPDAAIEAAASAPAAGAAAASSTAAAASGASGGKLTGAVFNINISGASEPEKTAKLVEETITRILEGDAAALGSGTEEEAA